MTLALRAYSAAAKLKEEDDFFAAVEERAPARRSKNDELFSDDMGDSAFSAPELTAEEIKTKVKESPATANTTDLVPFQSLKGRMDPDLLKALTVKPFNLVAMSEVQKRTLSRMPELAGGRTQKSVIENETAEQKEARELREKRGREDLLVKAKTGTGKTIAFLVPGIEARVHQIQNLVAQPDEDGNVPSASAQIRRRREVATKNVGTLVISPTRELATQIANEALKLLTWQKENQVQLLVGGESRSNQLKNWRSARQGRKDVVVATPGRLCDLLTEPSVKEAIANTDLLVLDEADTLLDMGFSDSLQFILDHLPKKRQTFLFSATVSPRIEKIAHQFLNKNHSFIDCVPKNESNVHMHIPQHVTVLNSAEDQLPHLVRLIAHDQLINKTSKIVIFLPTTKQTMLTATLLREMSASLPNSTRVHEIHSRLSQNQRSRASLRFRNDPSNSVLVTSDVSARGVDYPGVTRVIQVGIPSSPEQYVHRVGRTGRGGSTGGRGDIILQPFEEGFRDQLAKFPLNELSVEELAAEVKEKAEGHEFAASKIVKIEDKISRLLPALDPSAVEDVFMSLLGYYLGKSDMVGARPFDIFDGLKVWATGAGGLPEPPHVSPMMMSRLGLSTKSASPSRDRGGFGGRRGNFGMRDGGDRERSSFGGDRQRSFGGDRDRSDRPRRSFGGDRDGDRPRRSFGGDRDGDRPRRSFGGDRDGGDRPRRQFGGDRERRPRFDDN